MEPIFKTQDKQNIYRVAAQKKNSVEDFDLIFYALLPDCLWK
jgi:hypothetical protein